MSSDTYWKAAEEDMRILIDATGLKLAGCMGAAQIRDKIKNLQTEDKGVKNAIIRINSLSDSNLEFLAAICQ